MSKRSQIPFQDVLNSRISRRSVLLGASSTGLGAVLAACQKDAVKTGHTANAVESAPGSLGFKELEHGLDEYFTVAEGYQHQVLIAWGDPITAQAPGFDPQTQTVKKQEQQFGYNNDFIGFVSLPFNSGNSDRGLLVVNHEATEPALMFPDSPRSNALDLEQTKIDIAAHGLSVIEIEKKGEQWQCVLNSVYNRRITPLTEMQMSGPAAGSARLFTRDSSDGVHTLGTYGNCAGGVTPWGTILTGEENVDLFFSGDYSTSDEVESFKSFNVNAGAKNWGEHFERWNLQLNPRELLHMGWIVEIDPLDPQSKPRKLTALGRFKHEGANVYINKDGRVVAYMGDDEKFQYIYKFVSKNTFQQNNREANMKLLDEGELSVARFEDDGSLIWMPLVFGEGPLNENAGFKSQADVVIDARIAARLLNATPMDRPEDVDINPVNGHVYAMLTNNDRRDEGTTNAANPRVLNEDGQIVEFWPEDGDHSSAKFSWDMFLLAGKPGQVATSYHPQTSPNGWLSCPDNCAFDNLGNIWIATDGATGRGIADGLWASEVSGPNRALTKRFVRTPVGAEMCGPFFTPDSETLFCSVQHPASGSTFAAPYTRWPDFKNDMPPRPAVVAIRKQGGGRVGS